MMSSGANLAPPMKDFDEEKPTGGSSNTSFSSRRDDWTTEEQENLLNNIYNETHEMKQTFRSVRCKMILMLGFTFFLSLLAAAGSLSTLKHGKEVSVNNNNYRLETKNGNSIGTVGVGQTFKLPTVIFPRGSYDDQNASSPNPHVCVGVKSVVDMWRSTMYGVKTNAVVYGVFDGNYEPEAGSAFGVTLTFQGSVQNRTHACLNTEDKNLQICIDFANSACGTGSEIVKDVSFNGRRKLFEELVYDQQAHFEAGDLDVDGEVNHVLGGGGLRRLQDACTYGHWCHDFAALTLIGKW